MDIKASIKSSVVFTNLEENAGRKTFGKSVRSFCNDKAYFKRRQAQRKFN
jgi:hypothetical protein